MNMKSKKNICTLLLFCLVLFGFSFVAWLRAPDKYSDTERRTLAQKPAVTASALTSGKFMDSFDSYSMDQFPLRDSFRSLKAVTSKYLLGQKDNHGLYSVKGVLSKLEYPMNQSKVSATVRKINEIQKVYLQDADCSVYLSLIPDKNMFLAPLGGYPTMDYDSLVETVREGTAFAEYIDIFDLLSLEDYYNTDQHWRQECVTDVAERIVDSMNTRTSDSSHGYIDDELEVQTLDIPFYGAYVGQSALHFDADTIRYLTCDEINACKVTSYNIGKAAEAAMYDFKKAEGKDPYEFFLSGSDPLLVIENPNADTEKELVVFRDSFGSSLIPLLTGYYSKITVVDLRYMKSSILGDYVEFKDQDVLFLYSTLIMNNSISM